MGADSCPGMGGRGGRGGRAIGAGAGGVASRLLAPPRGAAFRVAPRRRTCASPASGEFPSALRGRGATAGSLCGARLFSGCPERPSPAPPAPPTPPTPACARSGALAPSRFARSPGVSARPPAAAARAPPPPLLALSGAHPPSRGRGPRGKGTDTQARARTRRSRTGEPRGAPRERAGDGRAGAPAASPALSCLSGSRGSPPTPRPSLAASGVPPWRESGQPAPVRVLAPRPQPAGRPPARPSRAFLRAGAAPWRGGRELAAPSARAARSS